MRKLLKEYLPHAPNMGLYLAPDIPDKLLENARDDYVPQLRTEQVIALYDATLLQSGKDGGVFLPDRMIYQNNDLEAAQVVRYSDIVGVREKRRWLGGSKVQIDVNQGRATVTHTLDFSGKGKAAPYVVRLLKELMVYGEFDSAVRPPADSSTNIEAVRRTLEKLVDSGELSQADFERLLQVLQSED